MTVVTEDLGEMDLLNVQSRIVFTLNKMAGDEGPQKLWNSRRLSGRLGNVNICQQSRCLADGGAGIILQPSPTGNTHRSSSSAARSSR